jgi:hypothetical protein
MILVFLEFFALLGVAVAEVTTLMMPKVAAAQAVLLSNFSM